MCVAGLSGVAASQGHPERAARLMGAAEALLETIGARLDPADFVEYTRKVSDVRDLLGTSAFSAAWSAGRAMPVEQAIASSSNGHAGAHSTYPSGLTEREAEVLRLVALGLTNVQVAEKLAISPRTVNVHLTSVYGKLGVASRTAAARFMRDDA
jgi:DNA-binding NarL/FixJ family response regulator